MGDAKFVSGLYVKRNSQALEYVICGLSIKKEEFVKYLNDNVNGKGYMNIDIKKSDAGEIYATLNEWQPKGDS